MGRTRRAATVGAIVALVAVPLPVGEAAAEDDLMHNVTYRARIDGLARGALISYRISDTQVSSADPAMLPGRTFEATAVLSEADQAGMKISIQWPYSANLICEILVDGQITVQASQFISPRVTPARDDPDYGALYCGAPLTNAVGEPAPVTDPATAGAVTDPAAPADPAAPQQSPLPPGDPVALPGTAVGLPVN